MEFLKQITPGQWAGIVAGIFAVAETIVRLTPTGKDNSILNAIKNMVDALLPNLKKDGGEYK